MFGLPAWEIRGLCLAAIVLVVASCGVRITALWYQPQIAGLKAVQAGQTAQAHATKVVQAALTKTDGAAETKAQAVIIQQTRVIFKKVPVYVSASPAPPVGCVTNGMLRLHDAAVLGVDPADLPPPAGQRDDACSAVSPGDFMAAVVSNYGAARQNGEQLNALEDDVKARIDAVELPARP